MFNILKEIEIKLFAENAKHTEPPVYSKNVKISRIYSTGNLISEYTDTEILFYPYFIYI